MKRSTGTSSFLIFFLCFLKISSAVDIINTNQIIRDGDTIVSSSQSFELGFFSPGGISMNRYVGIWYRNIPVRTPIWVANRESPLRNTTSGVLTVISSGQLVIRDGRNDNTVWSSNTSRVAQNPVMQLLDSGNLVIREGNDNRPESYLWQSFDHPTDTILQGMDFGWNLVTGWERYISSWTSADDPSPGEFTFHMDIAGYPQVVTRRRDDVQYRLGPWNGVHFSVRRSPVSTSQLLMNDSVVYYREEATDESVVTRFTLSPAGVGQRWRWVNRSQEWVVSYTFPADICDTYGLCGAHGNCNSENNPVCGCLDRFVPQDEQGWVRSDWLEGCVRRAPLNCTDDVFLRYSGIKMPDSRFTWFDERLNREQCEAVCLRNCSCTAYSDLDIRSGGSGCLLWFGELVDIRRIPEEPQEIYIRMAASELDSNGENGRRLIVISTSLVGIVLLGLSLMLFIWKRKMNKRLRKESHDNGLELPIYDLSTLSKATNGFSSINKLGQGGFGPVYKGMLEDGNEIAVKRLSKTSSQGLEEFKNEVICIAKLQHRNLVKLLGCSIQGEEKLLIYEYMPNKSLDRILFDETNRMCLEWPRRFHIINGIARGLMYLHQDSRLRIVHRDLKASNILLDREMNPRISDFGIAKRFRGNETEDKTSRVVGTYGYMSPEYAVHGRFSVKSDVFSFGVLVLEIVSGQRNSAFSRGDHGLNLLGHAWTLYKEGRSIELVDAYLRDSDDFGEVVRLIHLGLLCVQQRAEDRPNMSSVVAMLSNDSAVPQANHPGFFTDNNTFASESNPSPCRGSCTNDITITMLDGR